MWNFCVRRDWRRRYRYNGSSRPDWMGPIRLNFRGQLHFGWPTGTVYKFTLGVWNEWIGDGLVIRDEAFVFVEPLLRSVFPELHPMARYGATELPIRVCIDLAGALRRDSARFKRLRYAGQLQRYHRMRPPSRAGATLEFPKYAFLYTDLEIKREFEQNPIRYFELAQLFHQLADWLEWAASTGQVISLLGI